MLRDDPGLSALDDFPRRAVADDLGDVLDEGLSVYPDGAAGESGGRIALYKSVLCFHRFG